NPPNPASSSGVVGVPRSNPALFNCSAFSAINDIFPLSLSRRVVVFILVGSGQSIKFESRAAPDPALRRAADCGEEREPLDARVVAATGKSADNPKFERL